MTLTTPCTNKCLRYFNDTPKTTVSICDDLDFVNSVTLTFYSPSVNERFISKILGGFNFDVAFTFSTLNV